MAKNSKKANNGTATVALACVLYGGILGYAFGQSQAEKQAARRADKLETSRRLREMEAAIHKLTHPEAYDEHGRLKPIPLNTFMEIGGLE